MSRKAAGKAAEPSDRFLDAILRFFDYFRSIHPTPEYLVVRVTLVSSGEHFFRGFQVDSFADLPGFVMLRGQDSSVDQAVVVRADQVLSAEFIPWPPEPSLGFAPRDPS